MGEVDDTGSNNESNVGVLGWLGFIIINCAAFGIIAVSSVIAWPIGFAISLAYTITTIALAIFLRKRDAKRYRQFVNLLWVLGCSFLFILGLYLSINVIPGEEDTDSSGGGSGGGSNPSLLGQLPSGSSAALKAWAAESNWEVQRAPDFAPFGGEVFFNGKQGGSRSHLFRALSNGSAARVDPALMEAFSFAEFQSRLYFFAEAQGAGTSLWVIGPSLATAELVKEFGSMNTRSLRHLFVDGASSSLYFKATLLCSDAVFRSDGTTNGTMSLGQDCAMPLTGTGVNTSERPSIAQLWSVIFLACFPMLVLASGILAFLKMPGLFLNLFGGVLVAVVMVYLLAVDRDTSNMDTFLKYFITIYSAAQKVGIFVVSVLMPELQQQWLDELKSWAVVFVTGTFFIIIHIDLEIPFNTGAYWWRWVIYALLSLELMVFSVVVSRTMPMVLGAIGAFVVAFKISFEIVEAVGNDAPSEIKTLIMLGILGIQGIGIIVAAIFYAGRQQDVDNWVRGLFLRCANSKRTQA